MLIHPKKHKQNMNKRAAWNQAKSRGLSPLEYAIT